MVQIGSATVDAMPSVAFFEKPSQTSRPPPVHSAVCQIGRVEQISSATGAPEGARQRQAVMPGRLDGGMAAGAFVGVTPHSDEQAAPRGKCRASQIDR